MTKSEMEQIEAQIDYRFDNPQLLRQAFTRRSYTEEYGGRNNEVLEFIGDKVLDFIVVKRLSEYFGDNNLNDEFFFIGKTEGDLTEIKRRLVERKMLAYRMEELSFQKYLLMSKGDRKNNVEEEDKVKEDLFEAIIGAVAIDCHFDIDKLANVVGLMLNIEYYLDNGFKNDGTDFLASVQHWCQVETGKLPQYQFVDKQLYDVQRIFHCWEMVDERKRIEAGTGNIVCELRIDDGEPFVGFGHSKSKARMVAAELAYNYLIKEGLLYNVIDEIGEPELNRAINQLQELAQKGHISYPEYEFEQHYDNYGNPLWFCYCDVDKIDVRGKGFSSSKKDAKKYAALSMLKTVLDILN